MSSQQQGTRREHDGVVFQTAPEHTTTYEPLGCSATVTVPANTATVITSGHIGADKSGQVPSDVEEQLELAFKNVEISLKHAGVSEGWNAVYHMTTYHMAELMQEPNNRSVFFRVRNKYIGENMPAWTGITVPRLYGGALLEMTIYATAPTPKASL
ncbi:Endoribonuclease L-PSP/chorismate mutase-like protein [Mariannaea sp. PMI_226]|nr:Endoribonuclease L-PSP/chorismate mutase-like protein [Mariannaea sp. PMI_226]